MSDNVKTKERKRPTKGALVKRVILVFAAWAVLGLVIRFSVSALAAGTAGPHFQVVLLPPSYNKVAELGGPVDPDMAFDAPTWVTSDSEGALFVVDAIDDRIQKFTAAGELIATWGAPDDPGIDGPIATGPADELFVANRVSRQIEVYDGEGVLLRSWAFPDCSGSPGFAGGIAVSSSGDVYVTDSNNHRALRFSSIGTLLGEWGLPGCQAGPGDAEFDTPTEIAVDADSMVYIVDANHRIQKFELHGFWLDTWHDASGMFNTLKALTVNADGTLYAAALGVPAHSTCILEIDGQGNVTSFWGRPGTGPGEFRLPEDIAIGPTGDLYIVDPTSDRIQRFTADGDYLDQWNDGHRGKLNDWTLGMARDVDGNLYLADYDHGRIQVLDPSGAFLYEFGEHGTGIGQIDGPADVAVSADGLVYVLDADASRVLKFERDGTYLTEWGSRTLKAPVGITVDDAGFVYVSDTLNHRIVKFDASGRLLVAWGSFGTGRLQFNQPNGIAVHDGLIYVTDTRNNRVQVFDQSGVWHDEWGGPGTGRGQFTTPLDIAIAPKGDIFVADRDNSRIQQFAPDGIFKAEFTLKVGITELPFLPSRIAIAPDGSVYVLDLENLKVQIFRLGYPLPGTPAP